MFSTSGGLIKVQSLILCMIIGSMVSISELEVSNDYRFL